MWCMDKLEAKMDRECEDCKFRYECDPPMIRPNAEDDNGHCIAFRDVNEGGGMK